MFQVCSMQKAHQDNRGRTTKNTHKSRHVLKYYFSSLSSLLFCHSLLPSFCPFPPLIRDLSKLPARQDSVTCYQSSDLYHFPPLVKALSLLTVRWILPRRLAVSITSASRGCFLSRVLSDQGPTQPRCWPGEPAPAALGQ